MTITTVTSYYALETGQETRIYDILSCPFNYAEKIRNSLPGEFCQNEKKATFSFFFKVRTLSSSCQDA